MDDPRCGARRVPPSRWLRLFSFLARLFGQSRLQSVRALHAARQPQPEGEDWGDLWSTVHW